MAGDVAAFIERHDLSPATVVGHSLGGKVAMRLALTRPDLVGRLVVVDVAPVAYEHSFAPYVDALRQVDLSEVTRRADAERELEAAIPDAGVRSFLLQNLVKTDDGFAWRVNLDGLRANMAELMGFPADPDGGVCRTDPVSERWPLRLRQARAPAAHPAPVPAGRARRDRGRRPLGSRRAPDRVPGATAAVSGRRIVRRRGSTSPAPPAQGNGQANARPGGGLRHQRLDRSGRDLHMSSWRSSWACRTRRPFCFRRRYIGS